MFSDKTKPMLLWSLYAGTAKQKHMCGELVDRFSANSGSLNTNAVFALIDLWNFLIRINNIRAFTHFKIVVLQYTSIIYGAMGNRNIKSFGEIDF